MKTKIHLLLALALAAATSHAQQDPPKEPVKPRPTPAPEARKEAPPPKKTAPEARRETPNPKSQPRAERPDEGKKRPGHPEHGKQEGKSRPPHPKGEMTPFIGIAMEPVPPPLRAHFGIDEGFGVMVGMVLEDSPAAKAGIRQHDLVLKVDDQRIVNMEQLKALISSGKKGDVVKLTVISKGDEKVVDVTLDEKMMPPESTSPPVRMTPLHGSMHGFRDREADHPGREGFHPEATREWREKMEQFQERMRDFQEAMKKWHQGDRRGSMPQPPMMQPPGDRRPEGREPQRDGNRPPEARDRREPSSSPEFRRPPAESPREGDRERVETRSHESSGTNVTSATVSRRDESGEYVLSRHGRGEVFTVRPNRGETQSWDLSNKEARESIPPQFREKLEMLQNIRVDGR